MIEYRKGNLLSYVNPNSNEYTVIVHSANNKGVMGSGVAKAIITKHPQVKQDYVLEYQRCSGSLTLGKVVLSWEEGILIYTIIGQDGYGYDGLQYVDYNALKRGFRTINAAPQDWFKELAMPKIGAGLGGGDWKIIEKIIKEEFTNKKVIIYEL